MSIDRHLDWDGCYNVRDLGGIRVIGGGTVRAGAVVRADTPDRLSAAGWAALRAHGIRTIVDLRNDYELQPEAAASRAGIATVRAPLDDPGDDEFWTDIRDRGLDGTPLYYLPFLERAGKARRCAVAVAAVANAQPGGVLVHCGIGRDRTGLVVLLLLALVGAEPGDIIADYVVSEERLAPLRALMDIAEQPSRLEAALARANTTSRNAILTTLDAVDVPAYLRAAGLTDGELAAVRARMLG